MLPRRAVLGLLLTALGALPAAAGEAPAPLAPDIKRIRDRGRLVVAVAGFALPPFVADGPGGAPQGSDIELAQGMARALGVAVAFDRRARSFDELVELVARHDADLALSRLSETLDRALRVRFSRPYLVLRQALLLNRPRLAQLAPGGDPVALVDTPGASIGIVAGTAAAAAAPHLLPNARRQEFPRWQPELVEAVRHGEVTAGFGDELEVRQALAARPDAPLQLRPAFIEGAEDRIAVAVPWDSPQLLAWIDLYLETEARPPTVEGLLARAAEMAKRPAE
jgi:polar amino acid transport system substrate-binding protein